MSVGLFAAANAVARPAAPAARRRGMRTGHPIDAARALELGLVTRRREKRFTRRLSSRQDAPLALVGSKPPREARRYGIEGVLDLQTRFSKTYSCRRNPREVPAPSSRRDRRNGAGSDHPFVCARTVGDRWQDHDRPLRLSRATRAAPPRRPESSRAGATELSGPWASGEALAAEAFGQPTSVVGQSEEIGHDPGDGPPAWACSAESARQCFPRWSSTRMPCAGGGLRRLAQLHQRFVKHCGFTTTGSTARSAKESRGIVSP